MGKETLTPNQRLKLSFISWLIHNRRFYMRTVIKYLMPLIPALVIFGPLIMVIGYDPLSHKLAGIGALMTGLALQFCL